MLTNFNVAYIMKKRFAYIEFQNKSKGELEKSLKITKTIDLNINSDWLKENI